MPCSPAERYIHAQVMVVPISTASAEYAKEVKAALRKESFSVDVDLVDNKMEKKIREAQLEQYNYIVVCLTVSACTRPVLKMGAACKLPHSEVVGPRRRCSFYKSSFAPGQNMLWPAGMH